MLKATALLTDPDSADVYLERGRAATLDDALTDAILVLTANQPE